MTKKIAITIISLLLIGCSNTNPNPKPQAEETPANEQVTKSTTPLDYTKLPLGDNKFSTSPQIGYVYTCQTTFGGSGAFRTGEWIDTENGTWDLTQKIYVDGEVSWPEAELDITTNNEIRLIESKDLPISHTTGEFPVATNDDAYDYDRNPNSIEAQNISFGVPKNPTIAANPTCVGGEVGIATTGVLIFSAFDAGGRDAVATEIQDECEGHPQEGNYYHYHGYSSCFDDNANKSGHSDLLGYAFDGFGIYGLKDANGNELSSEDLDECHGHTEEIEWDGEIKEMYHYHFTQDFPYTVGCFMGEPSVKMLSSGEGEGQGQSGPPNGQLPPPRR